MNLRKLLLLIGAAAISLAFVYTYTLNEGVWDMVPGVIVIVGIGFIAYSLHEIFYFMRNEPFPQAYAVKFLAQNAGGYAEFSLDNAEESTRFPEFYFFSGALSYPDQRPFRIVRLWLPKDVEVVELMRRDPESWMFAEVTGDQLSGRAWPVDEEPPDHEVDIDR